MLKCAYARDGGIQSNRPPTIKPRAIAKRQQLCAMVGAATDPDLVELIDSTASLSRGQHWLAAVKT